MRIVVTGGAGFLGSHVVDSLVASGHQLTVMDNLSSGSTTNLRPDVPFLRRDVREPLFDLFAELRPEVVVHLAAQVSVPSSVADPLLDLSTNITGVVNIVEAAASAGARKIVAISSAAVYGSPSVMPITEGSPVQALSPYGLSKLTGEAYIRLLSASRSIAYTILRPANIYGPRQTTEGEGAVIPAFLDRFLSGRDPIIHGDGTQTRDFVHAADMARAINLTLHRADGQTLNVSSGTAITVNELWHSLAGLVGWHRSPVYGPARVGDIPNSVMANELARKHLGWTPTVSLAQGLVETLAWNTAARASVARP